MTTIHGKLDFSPNQALQMVATDKRIAARKQRDRNAGTLFVECLECNRKFKTKSMLPTCPRCGGSDIDPA